MGFLRIFNNINKKKRPSSSLIFVKMMNDLREKVCAYIFIILLSWQVATGENRLQIIQKAILTTKKLADLHISNVFEARTTDSFLIADIYSTNLWKLFKSRQEELKLLKQTVEQSYNQHVYDPNIKPFFYYNDKKTSQNVEIIPTYNLHEPVNLNTSFVQIPTPVFDNSVEILNIITYTHSLNEIFIEHFQKNPSTVLQYFGSVTGLFRGFPGIR